MATIVEWILECFIYKIYDALKALGMPSWLAITTLVVVFGGLLACGVYSLWTTQQIG